MTSSEKIKKRMEVPEKDCWDVNFLYKDLLFWEEDFKKWGRPEDLPRYPELMQNLFRLESADDVRKLFDVSLDISRHLDKICTYAYLRHDEDVKNEKHKELHMLATQAAYSFQEETSWIEPALLQLSQKEIDSLLSSPQLEGYRTYLHKILLLKPHTLNIEEEKLLAASHRALQTSRRVFRAFHDADMKFPPCKDEKGNLHELTHGMYSLYMKSKDRTLRKEAFLHLHETVGLYENTLCELLQGQMQSTLFQSRTRKYTSCLEAALYPHEIPTNVYFSLLETTKGGLGELHAYLDLRKNALTYSELHPYDLFVPIVKEVDIKMSYEEAVEIITESVAPLGEQFQTIIKKGLSEDRWVDRYENQNKRSGAYSGGCYDSMPYILMNYHGTFHDVMTLAHEAGHSMHSYFSRKHQPYVYSSYSIFLAEVASTFHEELLFKTLLKRAKTKEEKAYLIHQRMDGIRSTFFRQAMFAEFELMLHQQIEKGAPLTPSFVKEIYLKLNQEYLGSGVTIDPCTAWEWARIPHFYTSFYVYQYATGISAACLLACQVLKGDRDASARYLEMISGGSSLSPIEILQKAGVDMTTSKPVEALIGYFRDLRIELMQLL